MIIKSAKFVISNTDIKLCPKPTLPEYAFIGRSNVGKSSLINMLTERKELAKTSSKPGKTQLINHFIINDNWYLVDLPGYGYAEVSQKQLRAFNQLIQGYIGGRPNLMCLFVLIDSRLAPQKKDKEFIGWLGQNGVPFVMVFTKSDKLSKLKLEKNIAAYNAELLTEWEELPTQIITSAEKGKGREEVLDFIEKSNKTFFKN